MQNLTPKELSSYLKHVDVEPLFLDIRRSSEAVICCLENAEFVPVRTCSMDLFDCEQNQEIVVICQYGMRSVVVARSLEEQGYKCVINLTGGMNAWRKAMPL
jgi:rhodanese-related sulfurtransferase